MLLLISGEGPTDMGKVDADFFLPGPMACFVDQWIGDRTGYSLIGTEHVALIEEGELSTRAKKIKPLVRRGKKTQQETRYFYKNARALAKIGLEFIKKRDRDVVAVLFRDADGTASADRGQWRHKYESMLSGFLAEQFAYGVPMVPKPKSEAWILCALRESYGNCAFLENEPGNDRSPNALKMQLAAHLGRPATREALLEKIEQGLLDVRRIEMPSMQAFRQRCDDVLDLLKFPSRYL